VPSRSTDIDGRWFRLPGKARVDLARRDSLRQILAALVQRHHAPEEEPLTVEDLLRAGWPGQRVIPSAGAARVYTAVATLRNLGLRDVLIGSGGRYYLAPNAKLAIARPPRPS
jgi:hypothetical protein